MARRTLLQSLASLIRSETASLAPFRILSHLEETGRDLLRRDWIWTSLGTRGEVISFPLAQTGEGIAECELVKWLVKEGDRIKQFDKICEVQSDKASIEISSPYDGQIRSTPHEVGDVILVGNTLVEIELDEHQTPSSQPQTASPTNPRSESSKGQEMRPLASPAVRLFAKASNVELSQVKGTGPEGRILKDDVEGFLRTLKQPSSKEGRLEIKGYRRSMLKSMSASLTIPHFHFCDDIDLTELANLRQQLEYDDRLKGANLTYLPILVKALSVALKDFPEVNSSLSVDHSHLILHPDHNIGIAMMTDEGLVVPNIKGVQNKSILEISQELDRLKYIAFEKKLSKSDMSETTISISNIGPIGGRYASPLITPPQTAIVAIGRVRTALLPKSEINSEMKTVHAFPSLPISWGADHRVLDGATLVRFSNKWKALIEDPGRLILGLK